MKPESEKRYDLAFTTRQAGTCNRCGCEDKACLGYTLGRPPVCYHAVLCMPCANEWDDFVLDHELWERYVIAEETQRCEELSIMGGLEQDGRNFYTASANLRGVCEAMRNLARDWVAGKVGRADDGDSPL